MAMTKAKRLNANRQILLVMAVLGAISLMALATGDIELAITGDLRKWMERIVKYQDGIMAGVEAIIKLARGISIIFL